jgi:hypothetical protein
MTFRIILDSSTRRFQAHKIYLRAASATRWTQLRGQVLKGDKPNGRHAGPLRRIDDQLREVRHKKALTLVSIQRESSPVTRISGDRRHVAAMPAEAVISRSLGANQFPCLRTYSIICPG